MPFIPPPNELSPSYWEIVKLFVEKNSSFNIFISTYLFWCAIKKSDISSMSMRVNRNHSRNQTSNKLAWNENLDVSIYLKVLFVCFYFSFIMIISFLRIKNYFRMLVMVGAHVFSCKSSFRIANVSLSVHLSFGLFVH